MRRPYDGIQNRKLRTSASTRCRGDACVAQGTSPLDARSPRRPRLFERFHRRTDEAESDLADAGFAVGDAGVDARQDAGRHDLLEIDAGGRAAEAENRNGELGMLGEGDLVHLAGEV